MKSDTKYKLKVLATPAIWIRLGRTSKSLTQAIQHQLNLGYLPERIDAHSIRLGNLKLWGANYPYAFGFLRGKCSENSYQEDVIRMLNFQEDLPELLPARWMVLKLGALVDGYASEEQYIESYLANKNALASAKLRSSKPMDHGEGSQHGF